MNRSDLNRVFVLCVLAALTGCSRSKPPYSPKQSLQTFRVPAGFHLELVASEPEVSDPVAMSFDEHGRLWVVEMPDYPLSPKPLGRIKLLEDRDGDGTFEHSTVFTDGLHFPEGVMPWKNGIIVTCAPDILYFEDTNGDGRADVRKVLLTGFAQGNPQLRVNGPLYGIDNWLYVSYPRPPVPHRYVKEFGDPGGAIHFPDHPEVEAQNIHGMDVRFHLNPAALEPVAGNSQFGNAFDSWGNHYTVWNNDHIREDVIQYRYLKQNPYLAVPSAMQSLSDHEKAATVYPVTANPFYIHDSQTGHFTSACGISLYTGGQFPPEFASNSFTCEPVHGLVHRDILVPNGATFTAKRAYQKSELIGSTDSWFRPVFTTVGPDGALYIVDYYRFTVEHPEFVPPELLKEIDFQAHRRTGRIYRLVYGNAKQKHWDLASKSSPALVQELSDPSMWRRITAQRLLVDRQERSVVGALEDLVSRGKLPQGRAHALWTLEGLKALSDDIVLQALDDPTGGVRVHAVRLAEARLSNPKLKAKLLSMAEDSDPHVQFQVACTLGLLPQKEVFPVLKKIALAHADDPWFQIAALTGASEDATTWYRQLATAKTSDSFLERVASIVGARKRDTEIAELLDTVKKASPEGDAGWRIATLNGLAAGLKQQTNARAALPASQRTLLAILGGRSLKVNHAGVRLANSLQLQPSSELSSLIHKSSPLASNPTTPLAVRGLAIAVLGLDPTGSTIPEIAQFLDPKQPEEVRVAAATALAGTSSDKVGPIFVKHWREATTKVRDRMLTWYFADKARIPQLLDAVQAGTVQAWSLGPGHTQQLIRSSDLAIQSRAQNLLGVAAQSDRKAVYEHYLPALRMTGDPEKGRQVYERVCSECHKLGNTGSEVGPDLRTVTTHYKEALLADILMPNLNIESGYEEYAVDTTDGEMITGILAKDTPTAITLRRRKGEESTILRSSIKNLRSLSVSPMPEDLDKSVSVDQMADLIAYIKSLK